MNPRKDPELFEPGLLDSEKANEAVLAGARWLAGRAEWPSPVVPELRRRFPALSLSLAMEAIREAQIIRGRSI